MGTSKRLNPLDWAFLALESRESMMHVGALLPFTPPADAPRDLLRRLMEELRGQIRACPPWNQKLRFPDFAASPWQRWVEDPHVDIDYHVRRSALAIPGDERELGILVSRLHSNPLDFHRPPWEVHFIEGLEGGRFAMYVKVHHALVDGYSGIQLLSHSLSPDPDERHTPMFFARRPAPRRRKARSAPATLATLLRLLRDQAGTTRSIATALRNTLRRDHPSLAAPMQAPNSILNRSIGRNRRFATQQFTIAEIRQIARRFDATINDIVLAVCAAALRRFLGELGALPDRPLTVMVPVNIRRAHDTEVGNAVGAILASLATDIDDPVARTRAIVASTREAKAQLCGMSQAGLLQYSALLMAPMLLSQLPGAAGHVRPDFNLVISNVPGPQQPLYFRGCRMDAYYPLSIPFHGYGLNITAISYAGALNFGFTGCRDTVPHLQRLAVYSREALAELEVA